ncbi:hypothetical protein Loa_01204 [Legionella oakridgensis ATCC 33761 = DSM 21215]|uniref:DUF3757 domain-containing protein n=4 Tax=Legionella oakridgensis TaxID=29423 RepID=W0B8C0_9GAMM|nr:DUF3757 domain-containing protein [Legionella oakridgensis]AHE66758.1 hypothetical protein Loa_01204 [Legionella oakridgensis ATCC 33761 = DSM 21215]ETO93540.1 hypothetical protein LOR_92c25130 [Legionella oakridgensis RV-2-2007]KTD39838.1 hypothetical protein Loak_0854 [Legionella oakridgensis]STY19882.1 Uncharacterised protein [Legionella longbeachae]
MKNGKLIILMFVLTSALSHAAVCPNPETSSLRWGEVPAPWQVNPFSPNTPQGEEGTQFVRANILVAGIGRGVICTYQNSRGEYSIWWQVGVKIPAEIDYRWRRSLNNGFECTDSIEICEFYTAAG